MAERNPKIAVYRVLNVIRRCAIFQVALGFAQLLPSQFARIPGQRFQPSAKGTMDRSFHRRVPNQMPWVLDRSASPAQDAAHSENASCPTVLVDLGCEKSCESFGNLCGNLTQVEEELRVKALRESRAV